MKGFISTGLLLGAILSVNAQTQLYAPQDIPSNFEFKWLKQFESPQEFQASAMLNAMKKTPAGNFVIAGGFGGIVTYDSGEPMSMENEGHSTVFQINAAGELMWKVNLETLFPDCLLLLDIDIDINGNIYVVGVGNTDYYWLPTKSFVFKISPTGEILQHLDMGSQYLYLEDLELSPDGNLIIVGNYTANNVQVGAHILPDVPDHWFYSYRMNYVLIQLNVAFQPSVLAVGDGSKYGYRDQTLAIGQASGNIYVGGTKASTTIPEEEIYGPLGLYFSKFASNGNRLWEIQFDQYYNNGGVIAISQMITDENENIYMTGEFINQLSLTAIDGSPNVVTSSGQNEAFTAKFDSNGANLWVRQVGSQYDSELGSCLALDNEGNLWVAFNELTRPRIGNIIVDFTVQNVFVKYSDSGEILETLSMPGYENEIRSLAIDNNNDLYFTGWFWSDLIINGSYIPSQMPWQLNGFIGKIGHSAEGLSIYAQNFHGSPNAEINVPVKVSDFNSVVACQFSVNWDPAVVQFLGVEQFGLPGMNSSAFGTTQAANGHLLFSWNSADLQGVTKQVGESIFSIRFKLIATGNASTSIEFSSTPLPIEIIQSTLQEVSVNTQAGSISVDPLAAQSTLSGQILDANGNSIEGVQVELASPPVPAQNMLTDNSGFFSFHFQEGANLQLKASKEELDSDIEGIDVQDLSALRRHVLLIENLGSPYQIIASDVNASNSLTTLDILLIQARILGIINTFPNTEAWTFIDALCVSQ
jgi:hypothetical protein